MRRAATILVLGDPGPIRDELLLRPEVDVIWSASFEDARELLDVYRVEACIVAPDFEASEGYDAFLGGLRGVPVLVRRVPPYPDRRRPWTEEVEEVLAFLASHTGLVFARYPRAAIRLPVTIEAHGRKFETRTSNLSVSGMAVSDCREIEEGARVELCLELPEHPIYLLARVVRAQWVGGQRQAGLTFTDLQEGPRAALARCVDAALPEVEPEARLFGELEVPLPSPRMVSVLRGEEASRLPRAMPPRASGAMTPPIRRLADPGAPTADLPPWFQHLTEDLSDVERMAALGGDAPAWAHRVLRLRISIARARSEQTGEVPPALLDEAYRTFAGLEQETVDAPLDMQRQVSSIRASLLRDVLGEVA